MAYCIMFAPHMLHTPGMEVSDEEAEQEHICMGASEILELLYDPVWCQVFWLSAWSFYL